MATQQPGLHMTAFKVSTSVGSIASMARPFGAPRILMDEFASSGSGDVSSGDGGPVVRTAPADTGNMSISEAARALQAARTRKPAAAAPAAPTAPAAPAAPEPADEGADDQATAANELSDEGDAAPGENQATG